jgi:DNA-binding CsgD family transcriptional regulator
MTGEERATLLGDIVGSRTVADRAALHQRLKDVLGRTNDVVPPATPLSVTVGDEFQGTYARLGAALEAAFRIRLALAPEYDLRVGLGWGEVHALDADGIQDGPGWWDARSAIESVHELQTRPATRARRSAFVATSWRPPEVIHLVEAGLLLRDQSTAALSEVSARILGHLIDGHSQADIAKELDISPSAVSQRVRRDQLMLLVEAAARMASIA